MCILKREGPGARLQPSFSLGLGRDWVSTLCPGGGPLPTRDWQKGRLGLSGLCLCLPPLENGTKCLAVVSWGGGSSQGARLMMSVRQPWRSCWKLVINK